MRLFSAVGAVSALLALQTGCEEPPPAVAVVEAPSMAATPAVPATDVSPTVPAETVTPAPKPVLDGAKSQRSERPPKSKLLVPETAEAVGKWLDTFSYDTDVPVAIYVQGDTYYFSMEPPAGRIMRVRLDKVGEGHFVRTGDDFDEHLEIKKGNLQTRDQDGPIGTAKPLVE